jgi:hypothetical protein
MTEGGGRHRRCRSVGLGQRTPPCITTIIVALMDEVRPIPH